VSQLRLQVGVTFIGPPAGLMIGWVGYGQLAQDADGDASIASVSAMARKQRLSHEVTAA